VKIQERNEMDRMSKRQADGLTDELASHHFPVWTDPARYPELADALQGKSVGELARAFGRVETMLQALENYTDETGDLAASLVFEDAKVRTLYARRACERHAARTDLGPCAVPNTTPRGPDVKLGTFKKPEDDGSWLEGELYDA
jgi:hypothetical protein